MPTGPLASIDRPGIPAHRDAKPTNSLSSLINSLKQPMTRRFYEDDSSVVPVPGTIVPSSPNDKEVLGPRSVINGMTVRSTPALEAHIQSGRQVLYSAYSKADDYLSDTKDSVIEAERRVTGTVSSLHDRNDDLFPSIFYVAIATLSGNIMAQRRGLLSKALLPVGAGLAAFAYFMPLTFQNTRNFAWRVEQRTLPQLAHQQVKAGERVEEMVGSLNSSAARGLDSIQAGVESVRQGISSWTGLNIDEEVSKKK